MIRFVSRQKTESKVVKCAVFAINARGDLEIFRCRVPIQDIPSASAHDCHMHPAALATTARGLTPILVCDEGMPAFSALANHGWSNSPLLPPSHPPARHHPRRARTWWCRR